MPTDIARVYVRAKEGCGWVKAEFPFGGRKIFFAAETHVLRRNNAAYQVPAGVAYVLHRELEKRTKGRVKHMLVEQGLYHLVRLAGHTVRGNSDEIEEMYARRGQIREEAKDLLLSGIMSEGEHERILDELKVLESNFQPPKRAEQKLLAAKHLGKAHDLRASGDRRKIAPSSMTAFAAGKRVTLRIGDLQGIRRYFSGGTMRISALIREYHEAIESLWEFFERSASDRKGTKSRGAFYRLMDGLGIPAGRENALWMLRRRLTDYAASMNGLTFMPYRAICQRIASLLGDMDTALVLNVYASVLRGADNIRSLIRQLRMIHVIETTLVARLSWYLERMPVNIRSASDPDQVAFREQFKKVLGAVQRRHPLSCFHPSVITTVLDLLSETEEHLDDPVKAKEILKDLTAALAKDPYAKTQADERVA